MRGRGSLPASSPLPAEVRPLAFGRCKPACGASRFVHLHLVEGVPACEPSCAVSYMAAGPSVRCAYPRIGPSILQLENYMLH